VYREDESVKRAKEPQTGKKPYEAPVLVSWGSITDITRGAGGGNPEAFGDSESA
jgi:hypothetical protein